jgi:hypothetical protein
LIKIQAPPAAVLCADSSVPVRHANQLAAHKKPGSLVIEIIKDDRLYDKMKTAAANEMTGDGKMLSNISPVHQPG